MIFFYYFSVHPLSLEDLLRRMYRFLNDLRSNGLQALAVKTLESRPRHLQPFPLLWNLEHSRQRSERRRLQH